MISHNLTTQPRRLIAPGGPVTRAIAIMTAAELYEPAPVARPQFGSRSLDLTALAIGSGCLACWLATVALWIGGLV